MSGLSVLMAGGLFGKTRAELTQELKEADPKTGWWEIMDTGPFISDTFLEFGSKHTFRT